MATSETDLLIQLRVEQKNLETKINKSIKALGKMENKLATVQKQGKKTGATIEKAFSKMSKGIGRSVGRMVVKVGALLGAGGLVGIIGKSIKVASEFEKGMAEVSTLIGKDVPASMEKYNAAIRQLARTSSSTAAELSKGLYQVISAGTKGTEDSAQAMGLLKAAQEAAVAGVSDVFSSVDVLTTILNAYQMEASQATEITDALFTTIKLGKTTMGELSSQLGMVVSIAAGAGVSFDEVSASLVAMTKAGLRTDLATTALRATIVSIMAPSTAMKELMKELGHESAAAALEEKGLTGFMEMLNKATGGSTEKLQKLIPNVRALAGVSIMAGSGLKSLQDATAGMGDKAGAAKIAYEKMAETFSERSKKFKNIITDTLMTIGNKLLPMLLEKMEGISAWVSENGDRITKTIVGIAESIVSFGQWILMNGDQLIYLMGTLWAVGPIIKFISWVNKAGYAIKIGLLGPIGLAIAAVTVLANLLESTGAMTERLIKQAKQIETTKDKIAEANWKALVTQMQKRSGFGIGGEMAADRADFLEATMMGPQRPAGAGGKKAGPTDEEKKKWAAMVKAREAAENMLSQLRIKNLEGEEQKREEIISKRIQATEKLIEMEKKGVINEIQMIDGIYNILEAAEKKLEKQRIEIEQTINVIRQNHLTVHAKAWSDMLAVGIKKALGMTEAAVAAKAAGAAATEDYLSFREQESIRGAKIDPVEAAANAYAAGYELSKEEKVLIGGDPDDEGIGGALASVGIGALEKIGEVGISWAMDIGATLLQGKEATQEMVNGLTDMISGLAENLNGAIEYLASEGVPKIINALIDNAPRIIDAVIKGAFKISVAILKMIPELIGAILTEMLPQLVISLGEAIIDALKSLFEFGSGEAPRRIEAAGKAFEEGQLTKEEASQEMLDAMLFRHSGGLVDNVINFQDAIKAHSGMFVQPNIGANEVPTILEAGEGVIRRSVMDAMGGKSAIDAINAGKGGGGGGGGVVINAEYIFAKSAAEVIDDMQSEMIRKGMGKVQQQITPNERTGFKSRR